LDSREEQPPRRHHQHARRKNCKAGGTVTPQIAQLPTPGSPERKAEQAENAAKPRCGQRVGIGLVHEDTNGAEDQAAQKERLGSSLFEAALSGGVAVGDGLVGCFHATSMKPGTNYEKRIILHASIRLSKRCGYG